MVRVFIIAGPNGAGKTTLAFRLLPDAVQCREFVNADTIAAGLSAFEPESVAVQAGKAMLDRIKQLADAHADFAFETTLAARSFASLLRRLRETGYEINLLYLWLQTEELAIERVASRVRHGGHDVPEHVVRRRYSRGLENLFKLYMPLADHWTVYDSSGFVIRRIAFRRDHGDIVVECPRTWAIIEEKLT